MGSNFWNQQQSNNNHSSENSGSRPSGRLLRDYRHQQQQAQQNQQMSPEYSPLPTVPPVRPPQSPPAYSPMPPVLQGPQGQASQQQGQGQGWPSPQSWPSSGSPGQQGWFGNAMQTVRHWSGKFAAVQNDANYQPLVRYHPGLRTPPPKSKPWKRSRTVRIAMQMKRRRARWQRDHPNKKNILMGVLVSFCLLIVILVSSASGEAYAYYQGQYPIVQGLASQQIDQTTHIYDRHGRLLYDLYDNTSTGGRRTPVSYKYIPKVMQDAMIATEDHTFWENSGIDPQGIVRAATEYLQSHAVLSGGSTITQQLVKNLRNDASLTLDRKISEGALAIALTQQYPKWKILEMYFNVAGFGAKDLGVEAAVEEFFQLQPQCDANFNCIPGIYYLNCVAGHIKDCGPDPMHCEATSKYCDPLLGLARASLLAGMPQNPVEYDPTFLDNKSRALDRQKEVLGEMITFNVEVDGLGPITADITQQAEDLTAKMQFHSYRHNIRAPHFVFWVINQLEIALGGGDTQEQKAQGWQTLITGGFNVRTTIDTDLEDYVENTVERHLTKPEYQVFTGGYGPLNTVNNVNDAAVVVMDAKTGEILAMNGSTDYNDTGNPRVAGNFNAATAPRQPGSSFKPIVYTAAFQMGWYPGIVLKDQKTYFPTNATPVGSNLEGRTYHPPDYGGGYHNIASSIQLATANSFNIPAIKAFEFAGLDNVVNLARRMGITALDQDVVDYNRLHGEHLTSIAQLVGPSLALGTAGVPLIQMVGAYQVFANQGVRIPPQGVLDIWDNYGHHLYHYDPAHPHGIQVISPQIAYLMTSVLSDEKSRALEFGNIHTLSMWDWQQADGQEHDVAAKTGTTDNFKDNWTLGYTPDVVVGVWAGNADNSAFQGQVIGITGAGPIWHSVIERVSGRCNVDVDQVPCGSYKSPFTQRIFIRPDGVHQACVSTTNGLQGTGNCSTWLLSDEDPQQAGFPAKTGDGSGTGTGTGSPP